MFLTTAPTRLLASAWTLLLILTAACNSSPKPEDTSRAPAASAKRSAAQQTTADGEFGPADEDGTVQGIPLKVVAQKWKGDLDGMIERRLIRVLTVYSKTTFFVDKGAQLGMVPDAFKLFEDNLNKRLKNKNVIVHVVIVPVAADELIPALLDGRGDIVSAGKVATEWRREQVDFTKATRTGISSIVVTGPGVPPLKSLDDLAGKEVLVRASDVSAKNVAEFNARQHRGRQATRADQAGPRGAFRRRPSRDGQRRPGADDGGGRLHRGVLEAGLPGPRSQHGVRRPDRRRDGDDDPQGQPEARRRTERISRQYPEGFAETERAVRSA